jgi:hypothetical protein
MDKGTRPTPSDPGSDIFSSSALRFVEADEADLKAPAVCVLPRVRREDLRA